MFNTPAFHKANALYLSPADRLALAKIKEQQRLDGTLEADGSMGEGTGVARRVFEEMAERGMGTGTSGIEKLRAKGGIKGIWKSVRGKKEVEVHGVPRVVGEKTEEEEGGKK